MSNEALERLRWHKETGQTVISITKCEEAVADERKAVVERIRTEWRSSKQTESSLLAILDAEAAR